MNRKTKIIATLGPATLDFEIFSKLVDEGADIFRINTSYGDPAQYDQFLENIRKVSNPNLKVLYDIKEESKIDYFIKNNLDILAISFAETPEQIKKYKDLAPGKFYIAKIESQKGVDNIDAFLPSVDGIMIARGDLSEAIGIEKIPHVQKYLAKKTLSANKYLVVATEMMLSMTDKDKPEVAEASDVGNAVFDGASAVMLSEETTIGKHPVEVVRFMRKIIEETEASINN